MISFRLFLFPALAALSACVGTTIEQPPIEYQTSKALQARSSTAFTMRTHTRETGVRKEITGVPCEFTGQGFKSNFTTPAIVKAPELGGRTQVASVSCVYNGETKHVVLEPYNKTLADINASSNSSAAASGLVGAFIGSISAGIQKSRRDPSEDVYAYRDSSVVFADQ
ncbi:hypothetical protein GFB49_09980 [Epibacterium sp. SM1979]|uniref:Lipoprotein n=1 Tax=Tritonibacter litoralis TaxID=2662264 RepID=A0A843YHM7_9RHOB|nr:hypothetical protein [Tritonibacter litoralis]MQQ08782.1 hypothetical protein [Tritonibacter litoralis]